MEKRKHNDSRSIFWPVLLIGAGIIWLLGNLGIISTANIAAVFRMWPLVLIIIGLDMLIGQQQPRLRPLLGLLTVGAFLLIAIFGPALGLATDADVQNLQLEEPLAGAETATIRIDGASAAISLAALSDSNDLVNADIQDSGDVKLQVEGSSNRMVSLQHEGPGGFSFFFFGPGERRFWQIGLTPEIPLTLVFDQGSGSAQMDLSGLQLSSLNIEGGSGSLDLTLPAGDYEFRSDQSSGSWNVDLPPNAALQWILEDVGSGSLSISVPENLGVRLDVQDDGSGSLNVPSAWDVVSGGGDEGVWQSADYDSKDFHATITIENRGSGSIGFGS